ncbi:uncharacterized protein BO88DRAFT_83893 [Aspergillus vadensis CBS 113365]|uniref:Uncharacterized protein n=1 Tax=Aspergillus vadensis (strain CBS 113365 / IMI 142717 / IBT 24658) TaxID=1448311 RepID=A0A319B3N1_ASPVC|nr:hypothetical protein BO88DRAFT_83893 [Aspergillus vadensis CBS 113365]PYH67119.1 hypothetical protein BO88DRAFT_83893 [Aspergillus vadensis CBS 113365]
MNELRNVLASVEKKLHSGIRPEVSLPTESAPSDNKRPDSQAVSDESILTEKIDGSERDGARVVDGVVTIQLLEHLIDMADGRTLMSLFCEYDPSSVLQCSEPSYYTFQEKMLICIVQS